ncbi:MAG: hypothetical protein ACRCTE_10235 [Cellulosilyticaceae bacterium]
MLGNRIIGIMESLQYAEHKVSHQQNYEIVGELQGKLRNEYERFIIKRQDYIQNRERLDDLLSSKNTEDRDKFYWLMQKVNDFDEALLGYKALAMPDNQGAVILFQRLCTTCHIDILDELSEYYTVDGIVEQIEVGIKYLGRDEEIFKGLDIYHMLRETTSVIQSMNEQIQEYVINYGHLQCKVLQGLREIEEDFILIPNKKQKKINFYHLNYPERERIREIYGQIDQLEKMKKLPIYKGSLGENHLFMDQLFDHLEQVE